MAVTAFINLLSLEKSLLAIVLALLALRAGGSLAAVRARWALAIAAVHIVLVVAVLILFHDKLTRLLHLLQTLG